MKQSSSCISINLQEIEQFEETHIRNKNRLVTISLLSDFVQKKGRYFVFYFFLTVLTPSIFAVNNLIVSGITTPLAANGTYVFQYDSSGYHVWKHSTATYYIYYDNTKFFTWNIDDDRNSTSVLFFTAGGGLLTPVGASFSVEVGTTTSGVSVLEGGMPEITVLGNGNDIGDGNNWPTYSRYTKFGSLEVSSGSVIRSFTIKNDGLAALTISNVAISGANASDFTITSTAATSVAASGQTTFSVKFDPSALGSRTATITITNNDADEGTYDFSIQGYGYTPGDLVVSNITTPVAANGVYIHKGVLNGQYEYWQHSSGSYFIYSGIYDLQTVWLIDTDTDPTTYLFRQNYYTGPESPKVVGTWANPSSVLSTINITDYVAAPEINIIANNTSIVNNDVTPDFADYTHFGSVEVPSGNKTRTFTIQNTGGTALTLNGSSPYVTISGANASDFAVSAIPSSSITSGNLTTFQITFDPSVSGTRTAIVTISNNDGDEGTFQFAIKGDGIYPQNLSVTGMTSTSAAGNGIYLYQGIINNFAYWKHSTAEYYIYNDLRTDDGHCEWNIDADMLCLNANMLFRTTDNITSTLPIGLSWCVGNGTPIITSLAPEMNVKGNSVSIVDGNISPSTTDYSDFGNIPVCSATLVRTFTIENTSSGILYLSNPIISGTNASDFSVTTNPASTVASSGSTTFQVTFNPSVSGIRVATISISNNDADEGTYDFAIQGSGTDITITPISHTNVSCYGGSNGAVSINTPTGGTASYTYNWTPGNPTGDGTTSITGLSAGTWICTTTDVNGCTGTQSFTITQPLLITITTASQTNVSTYGGSNGAASINTPSGGAGGYTYNWTPGNPTGDGTTSITGLSAGTWTCLVTDANGCVSSQNFTITSTAAIINTAASTISTTSVILGGNISADGGASITERGVVYSTTDNTPTIAEGATKVAIGSGTGTYSQSISSLVSGITYYYNAYAINSAGISYGAASNFTTQTVPVITWANPTGITYGTLLSATQLNATANVAGIFTYTPALGSKLNAGTAQNLKVDFTPTDATNYSTATKTVTINVAKATPIITWSNPADINNVTALSNTQLNANADVPGTFTYTPAIGAKLNVGNAQVLKADFVPTDLINYESASKTVLINVILATGIREVENNELIALYPNPVEDAFEVHGIDGKTTITITDMNGKVVLIKVISANEKVSVTNFSSGIFMVKIETINGTILKKIVKE
jgi:hypothetical protein